MSGKGDIQFEFSYDEDALSEEILHGYSVAIIGRALELTALGGLRAVKILSPVNHGRLAGSWQINESVPMTIFDPEPEYRISTDTKYAEILHKGSNPYEIIPRNKEALYWPGAMHPVKRVMHPGIQRNTYIDDTIKDMEQQVPSFIEMALRETIGDTGG